MDAASVYELLFLPRERVFRPRILLQNLTDYDCSKACRIPREGVQDLCGILKPHLERETRRCQSIDVETQVITALSFYSSGGFQWLCGRAEGISQSSASRIIRRVTEAILNAEKLNNIKFPTSAAAKNKLKQEFYAYSGLPNCLGAVDCTHIYIRAPTINHEAFLDRTGNHSINVQGICDINNRCINLVAKWPGSCHDSFIWRNSAIRRQFNDPNVGLDGYVVGDSGYPLENCLMTLFNQEDSDAKRKYNVALRKARNPIERLWGEVKGRWRALDESGGHLQYEPEMVCKITAACFRLHNYCNLNRIPFTVPLYMQQANYVIPEVNADSGTPHNSAIGRRDALAARLL